MGRLAALLLLSSCTFTGATPGAADATPSTSTDAATDSLPPTVDVVYRINVAGPEFVGIDRAGTWAADDNGQFCFGSIDMIFGDVMNTEDDTLFHYMRFGGNGDIGCPLAVVNGDYTVVLHLAEIFRGGNCPGDDVRDYTIRIEGAVVDQFELVAENGGCVIDPNTPDAAPISKSYEVTVSDGVLDLVAGVPVDRGLLQAVEVFTRP